MSTSITRRTLVCGATASLLLAACGQTSSGQKSSIVTPDQPDETLVDKLVAGMSSEQLVSQLVIPAFDRWNEQDLTDLSQAPELAETLRTHQFGGVVLSASNIVDVKQTFTLVHDLQNNNAEGAKAAEIQPIPYFVSTDHEGGSVARLPMGTRGSGSMAIAATGYEEEQNALLTGQVFGEELMALGINMNLAPCVDVLDDPTNTSASTRAFSSVAKVTGKLAEAFADGMNKSHVISAYKSFPGAGDGNSLPVASSISLDSLRKRGIAAFGHIIEGGAECILASGITFPSFDEKHLLGDDETEACYPAAMSANIVTNLLRKELAFDGVVMTQALNTTQFVEEPSTHVQLLPGDPASVDYLADVSQRCLEAGCDVLLVPVNVANVDCATFLNDYIGILAARIDEGTLNLDLVKASVRRVLELKDAYDMLEEPSDSQDEKEAMDEAKAIVGSPQNHAIEQTIAEQGVTLVKNDGIVPLPGKNTTITVMCRTKGDAKTIAQILANMVEANNIDTQASIQNNATGKTSGSKDAKTKLIVDYYFNEEKAALEYSKDASSAVSKSKYVVCLSSFDANLENMQDANPCVQGITAIKKDAAKASIPFVLLSTNLPYDAARFSDSNAIVCSYLGAGLDIEPPTTQSRRENIGAYNPNIIAAFKLIFGAIASNGSLPINVPRMKKADDGKWAYTKEVLFERNITFDTK